MSGTWAIFSLPLSTSIGSCICAYTTRHLSCGTSWTTFTAVVTSSLVSSGTIASSDPSAWVTQNPFNYLARGLILSELGSLIIIEVAISSVLNKYKLRYLNKDSLLSSIKPYRNSHTFVRKELPQVTSPYPPQPRQNNMLAFTSIYSLPVPMSMCSATTTRVWHVASASHHPLVAP